MRRGFRKGESESERKELNKTRKRKDREKKS